jgi:hypothetical protein
MTETQTEAAKEAKPRAASKPHHIMVGDKPFTAFSKTKAGKEAVAAAGVTKEDVKAAYDSELGAKKIVRALRAHLKGENGAVIRGHAKIVEGKEPEAVAA